MTGGGAGRGMGPGTTSRRPSVSQVVLDARYELGPMIAEGGMAQVRRGHDLRLRRDVEVKLLKQQLAASAELLARFRVEAQQAAQYSHPNLVNVYDVGQDGPYHYIVMELLPGRTLKDLIAGGPLPVEDALELTRQVALGMAFAHKKGVVHRDLKPQNVLLTEAGHAKVADFGLAQTGESAQLTQPGTVWGTVQYLSPEQAQGLPMDARSDIYSLGAICYELLTGRPPYDGDTPAAIMMKHVYDPPPDPSEVNPVVPPAAARLVQRAMAKPVDDRFQSMDELAYALVEVRDAATAETALWRALPAQPGAVRQSPTSPPSTPNGASGTTRVLAPAEAPAIRPGPGGRPGRRPLLPPDREAPARTRRSRRRLPLVLAASVLLFFALMAVGASLARQLLRIPPTTAGPTPRPAASATAAVAGATATTAPQPTPTVALLPVPNVIGDPLPTAQAKLAAANLAAEQAGEEFSDDVARGSVARQDPAANARLEAGKPVRLTLSRGPQKVRVPSVAGKSFDDARGDLTGAGFVVRRDQGYSARAAGQVYEQRPAANELVDQGAEVTVFVSQGPLEVTMPQLKGRPVQEALDELRRLGLQATVGEVVDISVPTGAVSQTAPDAGQQARRDRPVTVAVNRGVPATPTPVSATQVPAAATAPAATATRPAATTTAVPATPTRPAGAAATAPAVPSATGAPSRPPGQGGNPPPGQRRRDD